MRRLQNSNETVSMTGGYSHVLSRRDLLRRSVLLSGLCLNGFDSKGLTDLFPMMDAKSFGEKTKVGTLDFCDEGSAPMDEAVGIELDGRLFTDLSKLSPGDAVIPNDRFYIRTRASQLLEKADLWSVRLKGSADKPLSLPIQTLNTMSRPMGLHLMECAGNSRSAHFGMLGVADWDGVPLEDIFDWAQFKSPERTLIAGFDRYAMRSQSSIPGASWIFTSADLFASRAFLATRMNNQPLTPDHGAPVRLVAPGWYGCACIKWVEQISPVAADVEATSQMREYASRTMQNGIPRLASDYQPALIDPAALPVRVEKWLTEGKIIYRVIGLQWGGPRPPERVEIQFNPDESYVPVTTFESRANGSWNFWSHTWTPRYRGKYTIGIRLKMPGVATRRLDSGYYRRSIEITEL